MFGLYDTKIILVSMIKNEEKIIRRCIDSVRSICDAFCVSDTSGRGTGIAGIAGPFGVASSSCSVGLAATIIMHYWVVVWFGFAFTPGTLSGTVSWIDGSTVVYCIA